MTKSANIISFRNPGEKCGNCLYYVPDEDLEVFFIGRAPSKYCRHPALLHGYDLTSDIINSFQLHRAPDDWCSRYTRI